MYPCLKSVTLLSNCWSNFIIYVTLDPKAKGEDETLGFKTAFDNLDIHKEVHHMTEDHQNIDEHYCAKMSVKNRVGGNHISPIPRNMSVLGLDNSTFLPSRMDHWLQRLNYISLVSRVLRNEIPCLMHLGGENHISHQYSKEMSKPTEMVR